MKENDYHRVITLLFGSDKFINDITEALAFNHPISTQEYMLSANCENISSKVSKNSSSTPKSKSNECIATLECDKYPSKVSNNSKNHLQLQNRNQIDVLHH